MNENYEIRKNKVFLLIITILIIAIISVGGVIIYNVISKNDENKVIEKIDDNKNIDEKIDRIVDEQPIIKSNVKIIDVNSKTRPYAVMINCHNEALPQAGLQNAYIVYELMVEYGITRMMALFKDVDFTKVGSIRSARAQYLPYVYENDAIYAHAGGSPEALNLIKNNNIDDVDVDGKYGQRDKELRKKRAYEHTLFTSSALLSKGVKDKGLRSTTEVKNLLTYSEEELDLSKYKTTPANKLSIKYSNYRTSNYEYDKNKKVYLRSMNKTKNVDLITGKQYEVKNIIAYGVKYTSYTYNSSTQYQRPSTIGTGEGYYITDGVALPITWSKADERSQTVYKIKETGEDLVVNDGNTYIQRYPTSGKFTLN